MTPIIWTPGTPLGQYSAERMAEIQGIYTGPLAAVLDENGECAVIQPMDPNTGENWHSEEDAMAWAIRYCTPPEPDLEQ